jgi:excisionase family DNA binding protein
LDIAKKQYNFTSANVNIHQMTENTIPQSGKLELLTTKEVMELLKVSRVTLHKMRKNGLKAIKIGDSVRFNKSDVEDYLKMNIEQVQSPEVL